jgi:hypothetical protein
MSLAKTGTEIRAVTSMFILRGVVYEIGYAVGFRRVGVWNAFEGGEFD